MFHSKAWVKETAKNPYYIDDVQQMLYDQQQNLLSIKRDECYSLK